MLRCFQMGLHITDLEALSIGMIYDLFTESENDNFDWQDVASQDDYDNF